MLHKWNHSVECFRVRAGFFPLHGCASGIHSCVCMDCGSFIVRVPWEHAATSLPVSESPDTGRLRPRAAVCMLPRGRRRTRLPWVGPWERNGWITGPGPSDFVGKNSFCILDVRRAPVSELTSVSSKPPFATSLEVLGLRLQLCGALPAGAAGSPQACLLPAPAVPPPAFCTRQASAAVSLAPASPIGGCQPRQGQGPVTVLRAAPPGPPRRSGSRLGPGGPALQPREAARTQQGPSSELQGAISMLPLFFSLYSFPSFSCFPYSSLFLRSLSTRRLAASCSCRLHGAQGSRLPVPTVWLDG
uniref:uncharacterized protein LOC118545953 n=1 Tax=Halichoerus grypus TaxID=9711 RepID=UPI0016595DEA|nr:uncharacterized protein LOC118545953 [Halichoerus grypus]